VLSHSHKL